MNKFDLKSRIKDLKANSGSHSPSIDTLISQFDEFKINIDACFLSNEFIKNNTYVIKRRR